MLIEYAEDPYVRPPNRLRRTRIAQDGPRTRSARRVSPQRSTISRESNTRDEYYNEHYDDYYEPPPPPRSTRLRAPLRRQARAPAYYYPEDDDYYDRPRRRPVRNYEEDYARTGRASRVGREPRKTPAKSSSGGGSGTVIAVVVIILIILLLYMFRGPIMDFIENPPPLKYQEFPEGLDFTVRKSMSIKLDGNEQRGDSVSYILKSACPKDSSMRNENGDDFLLQDVQDVDVQPEPNNGYPDFNKLEQEIMLWSEEDTLDDANYEATYTIRTRFYEWEFDEEESGVIADIPTRLKQQYNHDEWVIDDDRDGILDQDEDIDRDGEWDYRIEMSSPSIQRLASNLADGKTNVYLVVKSFYDYLTSSDNLNYIPSSDGLPKDCITTLNRKSGDCDDYSILFVSLCRAVDIPAWLELGVLYDRQAQRWGGHGWAKVAIPFEGGTTYATIDIVNKHFLFHDPYRFIEWVDNGGDITVTEYGETKTVNNLDYYYHSFSYRSFGRPTITSPDTNSFQTIQMNEFGDTQRIPVEDETGSGLCMIPGFEAWDIIAAMMIISFIVIISKPVRFER